MGLSETLKAISAPIRRQILEVLKSGPKSAGQIVDLFHLSGATVSHHLSVLKKSGLILEEKQKNFIYYRLNYTVFEEVLVWIASFGGERDEKN
ncbi:transcriptional regulator [Streptococcus azizii]|uniref:Transcriptional regulator n=1 Tax=Streptococcus azizii TaxID=1579424 RepID=A0AB36JTA8_9STRE|nr:MULTISPECIES: autorepressor SdpR family transcription factor [Streptococcus]MBF0775174.1 winged helix-turn-helix transcriptional regulator [Streptococcus sp. 19428wD3_AN2]ONK29456.1 transcriptional regulator [Streptococcus azizii]ONK29964.1 transcriptional regulator [Streptococcus azizii]ONK30741.1 transcriptional regulator [Streptococcus azizii]TFU84706.1 ArsR family transcriptional regulator [Streptococcus sp. AN2]